MSEIETVSKSDSIKNVFGKAKDGAAKMWESGKDKAKNFYDEKVASSPLFKQTGDANNRPVENDPNDIEDDSIKNKQFSYPIGINDMYHENAAPHIRIRAFKYKRRSGRQLRVYGFGEGEDVGAGMLTELEADIYLPFYGSLSQGHESNTSPLNSMYNAFAQSDFSQLTGNAKDLYDNAISNLHNESGQGIVDRIIGSDTTKMALFEGARSLLSGSSFNAMDVVRQAGLEYGVALNPMTEMSYGGEEVQRYNLSFNLVPRSRDEHIQIDGLINRLRELSMGELTASGTTLLIDYPAIFNIDWLTSEGKPIVGPLPSTDCYLNSVGIVFNPQGRSHLYEGDMPVSYQLNLGFVELRAIYRDDVRRLRRLSEQPTLDSDGDYKKDNREIQEDGTAVPSWWKGTGSAPSDQEVIDKWPAHNLSAEDGQLVLRDPE